MVDGVVLFIPVEGALSMALERDPQLLEHAFSKNIILTFPTSLLAILKGLAMTIQQEEIAKNIDEIQAQAVELHKRRTFFSSRLAASLLLSCWKTWGTRKAVVHQTDGGWLAAHGIGLRRTHFRPVLPGSSQGGQVIGI